VTVSHDPVVSCRRAGCPSHGKKKKRKTWRGVGSGHWNREVFFFVPLTKKERKNRFLRTMVVVEKTDDSSLCGRLWLLLQQHLSLSLSQVGGPTRPTLHSHTPVCDTGKNVRSASTKISLFRCRIEVQYVCTICTVPSLNYLNKLKYNNIKKKKS